jgi:hypothetical protein
MRAKRIIRGRETDLFSPVQHKPTTGNRIVLPAGKTGNVVRGLSSVEIASFYSQSDPSPELHINASTEIECSSVKFARSLIGSAIDPEKALFVEGVTAAHGNIG